MSCVRTRLPSRGESRTAVAVFLLAFMASGFISESGAFAQVSSLAELGDLASSEKTGTLSDSDMRRDGRFVDIHTIEGTAGQFLIVALESSDFDTVLGIHPVGEDGQPDESSGWTNDDYQQSTNSQLQVAIPDTGEYAILVSSYEASATGRYRLTVTTVEGRVETGKLQPSDFKTDDRYFDIFKFEATRGQQLVLDLHSQDFDTFLKIRPASDTEFMAENDDYQGDTSRSQLFVTFPDDGLYVVHVTSFNAGETGDYLLTITEPPTEATPTGTRRESGELADGDDELRTGEYVDQYSFEGVPGQRVRIELTSRDFDTYLILRDPRGESEENDDFANDRRRSVIDVELKELGTYLIGVTSYEPGESGRYDLVIELDGERPEPEPERPVTTDVVHVDESGDQDGQLERGDLEQDDRLVDLYSFQADEGQRIRIDMTSNDFDGVLIWTAPDGAVVQFDDFEGGLDPRMDVEIRRSGRHRLAATSYDPGAEGRYRLRFDFAPPEDTPPADDPRPLSEGSRIFGVFVGISDYPGTENDLSLCDNDARVLHQILTDNFQMSPRQSVLLVNEDATVDAVAAAVRQIGDRAGPDDLLLFFYSGHGGRREGSPDVFDPNGFHETLVLYDGEIMDDEFALMVNASDVGTCMVVLDACFSGGFAKDVVSTSGRMGIFSSEEDVLSMVPDKFRAGGYLSAFFADAIHRQREVADADRNRALTAHELSDYLEERFTIDVRTKSTTAAEDGFVDPSVNLNFQRLVIDRGGVSPYQVLFRWE